MTDDLNALYDRHLDERAHARFAPWDLDPHLRPPAEHPPCYRCGNPNDQDEYACRGCFSLCEAEGCLDGSESASLERRSLNIIVAALFADHTVQGPEVYERLARAGQPALDSEIPF